MQLTVVAPHGLEVLPQVAALLKRVLVAVHLCDGPPIACGPRAHRHIERIPNTPWHSSSGGLSTLRQPRACRRGSGSAQRPASSESRVHRTVSPVVRRSSAETVVPLGLDVVSLLGCRGDADCAGGRALRSRARNRWANFIEREGSAWDIVASHAESPDGVARPVARSPRPGGARPRPPGRR